MARSGSSCFFSDFGLLLMRLILAVVFVFHGGQKLMPKYFGGKGMAEFTKDVAAKNIPHPELAAQLSAYTELVGGVLIGIGFLTRLAAIPMAFNMYVAAFLVHRGAFSIANFEDGKWHPGMEYALALAVFFTALIFTGPGKLSVDGCLFCRRCAEKPAEPSPTKKP